MNQQNSLLTQPATQGIVGWVSNTADCHSGQLPAMCAALNSRYPTEQATSHNHEIATTGALHKRSDKIIATIIGTPRWRSNHLQTLAANENDASALADAYRQYGPELLAQLSGAFCFVIIDLEKHNTLAAIDRSGQFSLYFAPTPNGVVFSNHLSPVTAHQNVEKVITEQGIYNYVYFHMIPGPDTIYKGVHKLQAGHWLSYNGREVVTQRYWQPSFSESNHKSVEQLSGELKQRLHHSVKRHCHDGVTTGSFLSGGLDSSTVTGHLAGTEKAKAYSIGFSADGYDEMEFARITAKHFNIALEEYYVTPDDVVKYLPLIATSYDEPFGNSSALPAYFCAKRAAEDGVDTLLAGDGGDEIFAGNERYAKQHVFELYQQVPSSIRQHIVEPLMQRLPQALPLIPKAMSYIEQANTPLPARLQSYNFLHRHRPDEIFASEFLESVSTSNPLDIQADIYHAPQQADSLNRMLFLDWQITLADNDIRKVSNMCALAGVNVAYPMLDDDLIDFSCSLPSNLKLKNSILSGGQGLRHFYKKSLTGWLPDATINKKKQGFGLPFGVWMRSHKPLQDLAYDTLTDLKKRYYFADGFIDNAIDMHRSGHAAYYGELIWVLAVFELWANKRDHRALAAA